MTLVLCGRTLSEHEFERKQFGQERSEFHCDAGCIDQNVFALILDRESITDLERRKAFGSNGELK